MGEAEVASAFWGRFGDTGESSWSSALRLRCPRSRLPFTQSDQGRWLKLPEAEAGHLSVSRLWARQTAGTAVWQTGR